MAQKYAVLGVGISAVTEAEAVAAVIDAAQQSRPFALTALAVHGVMTGVMDAQQRCRLNQLDMVTPDGQPVRWALNRLHGQTLARRVYGPDLTLTVCAAAEAAGLPVAWYGSTPATLTKLQAALHDRFPRLPIAGVWPSQFRRLTADETAQTAAAIRASGAKIVFVGLGCPRQETWAYEMRDRLGVPILAVGAAFDFLGGNKPQAPTWMQTRGLEWLFRLVSEPRRLWRRYLLLNPAYIALVTRQALTGRGAIMDGTPPSDEQRYG